MPGPARWFGRHPAASTDFEKNAFNNFMKVNKLLLAFVADFIASAMVAFVKLNRN